MKNCAYCGTENPDEAILCRICHTEEFKPKAPTAKTAHISNAERLICLCSHCSHRLRFSAERVGETITCPNCNHITKLYSPSHPEAGVKGKPSRAIPALDPKTKVASEAAPSVVPPGQWHYGIGPNRFGPFPGQVIIDKIKARELEANTKVWTEGFPKWILLKNSPFRDFVPKQTGPPSLDDVDETAELSSCPSGRATNNDGPEPPPTTFETSEQTGKSSGRPTEREALSTHYDLIKRRVHAWLDANIPSIGGRLMLLAFPVLVATNWQTGDQFSQSPASQAPVQTQSWIGGYQTGRIAGEAALIGLPSPSDLRETAESAARTAHEDPNSIEFEKGFCKGYEDGFKDKHGSAF